VRWRGRGEKKKGKGRSKGKAGGDRRTNMEKDEAWELLGLLALVV